MRAGTVIHSSDTNRVNGVIDDDPLVVIQAMRAPNANPTNHGAFFPDPPPVAVTGYSFALEEVACAG